MAKKSDAVTRKNDSAPIRRKLRLTPAQRHKYQREIAVYRGMFGGTDIAMGDVQAWAARRASIPEMAEVDSEIAAFRRWECRLWRSAKRRDRCGL